MKVSHWIGGALLASALFGYGSAALAEDAAPPPADAAPAAAAGDAAATPAPAKPAKKKAKMGAADGIWTGTFIQVGHSGGYKMAIKFAGKTIETDYPDQSCGGKLTKVGAKGDTSFYVETITRGGVDASTGKGCIDGNVTLIKAGEGFIWGWVGQHDGKPIVAYATLAKQAAAPAQ